MKKKIVLVMLLVLCLTFAFVGCNPQQPKVEGKTVTDVMGNQIVVPEKVDRIVCLGSGALRLICYADAVDKLVGIENMEVAEKYDKFSIKRPYNYINKEKFKNIPVVAKGDEHWDYKGVEQYEEKVLAVKPDVIFTTFDKGSYETLTKKMSGVNIPVVSIKYTTNIFDPNIEKSMEIIGKVLNKEERCKKVIKIFQDSKNDLNNRTKDIKDSDKKLAYFGAVCFRGAQGIDGTYANFGPAVAVNAKNLADQYNQKAFYKMQIENIVKGNPDVIFVDSNNMDRVRNDFKKYNDTFKEIPAVQNNDIYKLLSYNFYSTNIELALADAYFIGKKLYPEQFKDIDVEVKVRALLKDTLGKDIYTDMVAKGMEFGVANVNG